MTRVKKGLRSLLRAGLILFALALVGLLGVWVANSWLMPRHVAKGTTFPMPALESSSRDEVYAIAAAKGLVLSERPAEYDASLPSGYLLRQIPRAGTSVKPGRHATVVFSAGPRQVTVPSLRGQSERQARLQLEDLGLVPGDVLRCAGSVEPGQVLSTRPGLGARIPVGARVDILLSSGAPREDFLVPDMRQRDLDTVLAMIEGSGLPEPRLRYRAGMAPAGSVLEQFPPPGSRLEKGRDLELVVASEPN